MARLRRYREFHETENIVSNIPDDQICGVYALVDDNGMRYIGSSKNIKQRLAYHNYHMKNVLISQDKQDWFINDKMQDAVRQGRRFTVEILAAFNCEMSTAELREIERVFIKKYSDISPLYNKAPIKHKI